MCLLCILSVFRHTLVIFRSGLKVQRQAVFQILGLFSSRSIGRPLELFRSISEWMCCVSQLLACV